MPTKQLGLTKASGFQIGVRRTLNLTVEEAWELLSSTKGIQAWLGNVPALQLETGMRFHTDEGISGQFTTVNPYRNIRLAWQSGNWDKASIVQVRTIASGTSKTTISFHQEKLDGPETREAMKRYWEQALNRLMDMAE